MMYDLFAVHRELMLGQAYVRASTSVLQAEVRRIGVEELNLPEVAVELFMAARGYHCGAPAKHAQVWTLAVARYLRGPGGWLTVEEASASGAWDQALRTATWLLNRVAWPEDFAG